MKKLFLILSLPVILYPAVLSAQTNHEVFEGESIQAAIDGAAAGDTVLVGRGTFTGSLMIRKKIHLIAADDRDSVIILTSGTGVYFDSGSNGSSLRGFTVTSTGEHGVYIHYTGNADPYLLLNNRIVNCAKDGVLFGNWFDNQSNFATATLAGNEISHNKTGVDPNRNPFITLAGNVISLNDSIGVDNFYGISAGDSIVSNGNGDGFGIKLMEGAWLTGATVTGNQGDGVWINDADKAFLYGNFLSGNSKNGLKVTGGGRASWKVSNNLVTGNGENGILVSYDCDPGQFSESVFSNNILAGNAGSGIRFEEVWFGGAISGDFTFCNTIVTGNGNAGISKNSGFQVSDVNLIYNTFFSNTGGDFQDGFSAGSLNFSADPGFVNAAGGDYHLVPGSPLINAGQPSPAYSDLDLTRNDQGIYGGSFGFDQYYNVPGAARLIKLTLSNRFVRQGESITIQAQGIAR